MRIHGEIGDDIAAGRGSCADFALDPNRQQQFLRQLRRLGCIIQLCQQRSHNSCRPIR